MNPSLTQPEELEPFEATLLQFTVRTTMEAKKGELLDPKHFEEVLKHHKALLESAQKEARIDELERLLVHHSIHSMDKAYHDKEMAFIQSRLERLKALVKGT